MASIVQIFTVYALLVASINAATIRSYASTPRINSGAELISSIAADCFSTEVFSCINEKVLNFLDSLAGVSSEESRTMKSESVEEAIFQRVGRILSTNEFRLELPRTLFQGTEVIYRPDTGFDLALPKDEARGLLLKKKLLLPVLLLLKLKMKALMPIIVALVGLKAMKALILSKIAIKLVLGFLIYQLIQKLGGMKMAMMPMMPMMPSTEPPMPSNAYGAPPSSYEPQEPAGGPYARIWDASPSSSAQNLAYSAYYPSSSSYTASSAPASGSSSSAATSSSSYS